jgi:hypothetical protein
MVIASVRVAKLVMRSETRYDAMSGRKPGVGAMSSYNCWSSS